MGDSAALEHVVDVAVGAGPVDADAVFAGGLAEDTHALKDGALYVPDLGGVGEGAGDGLLAGDVDVLALAGEGAVSVGEH